MNLRRSLTLLATAALAATAAQATTPTELLAGYQAEAGGPASATRGQAFFSTPQGGAWSCSSCHGAPPTGTGKHASTGKAIRPLAPAFDAQRFTDAAKVEKWFRRNCKDVASRECTAGEKADVMAWLVGLKP